MTFNEAAGTTLQTDSSLIKPMPFNKIQKRKTDFLVILHHDGNSPTETGLNKRPDKPNKSILYDVLLYEV